MWGILTNMVSTRRSSARLQERQGGSSAPTSPTPSAQAASPSTRRRQSLGATKATSPSARNAKVSSSPDKSARGRGRGRSRKATVAETVSDEGSTTQSDEVPEQHTEVGSGSAAEDKQATVTKELFADEAEVTATEEAAKQSIEEEAVAEEKEPEQEIEAEVIEEEVVAEVAEVAEVAVAVAGEEEEEEEAVAPIIEVDEKPEEEEVEEEEEEVEEEIVMIDTSEGEQEDEQEQEDDEDEDIDVEAFAKIAASGISLSVTKTASSSTAPASKAGRHLVPDTLDSGASSRTKFLEFEGTKQGLGAKVVAATVSVEEQKVLAQQLGRVAKANRQRSEAQNTGSAGRKWFDMSTHEMDADARRDFALLKMRNYLDPKKFYKTSDHTKKMPKHFQMGTVIEGAHEFKSARLTKKERKQTFTDEIMADDSVRKYTKRVFLQVQNARAGGKNSKNKKPRRF